KPVPSGLRRSRTARNARRSGTDLKARVQYPRLRSLPVWGRADRTGFPNRSVSSLRSGNGLRRIRSRFALLLCSARFAARFFLAEPFRYDTVQQVIVKLLKFFPNFLSAAGFFLQCLRAHEGSIWTGDIGREFAYGLNPGAGLTIFADRLLDLFAEL